ncbi:hypothetical protein AB0M57_32885 [Streptomyces sp. NPDC051597]|uniref:hypothetical protein n=1 Tax=Streptomyces sp. NPDC051597 TaxID=3155049 RepID=UPI0034206C53
MGGEHGVDLSGSGAEPLAPDDPRRIGSFPLVGMVTRCDSGRHAQLWVNGGAAS